MDYCYGKSYFKEMYMKNDSYCLKELYNGKSKKESKKAYFNRLISFRDLLKSDPKIPVSLLASFGYYYDVNLTSIKCAKCKFEFNFLNLKEINTKTILIKHSEYEPKCANNNQIVRKLIESEIKEDCVNSRNDMEQIIMRQKESRESTFNNVELKDEFLREYVENGFLYG